MALILIPPKIQFFDDDGTPLAGGKVYTYAAGTSIPKTTWKDEAKTQSNLNPVILDSIRGEAVIRLDGSYKINVTDSNDVQITGYPVDNITEYDLLDWTGLTASIADLNSTTTTVLPKTADYTITLTDRGKTIAVDATGGIGGKVTVSALSAATLGNGYKIIIKKTDKSTNYVDFVPVGVEKIDTEALGYRLYDVNDFAEFQSDGSNWIIVAARLRGTLIVATSTATAIPKFNDNDTTWLLNAASGAIQVNLLASNVVGRGYELTLKKTDSSSNKITIKPNGSEKIDGSSDFTLKTQNECITIRNDGSNYYIISETSTDLANSLPRGYIDGLTIERDSGDTDHDTKINIGECRNTGDNADMKFLSALVKRIDANWVAGTGNGGFPSALTLSANTWYHVFAIGKTDGTADVGYDTSVTSTNLLADATGYTLYRRIASIRTDASLNIIDYIQHHDIFYWKEARSDYNTSNPGTSIITTTLSVPPNVYTDAILGLELEDILGGTDTDLRIAPTFVNLTDNLTSILHVQAQVPFVKGFLAVMANTSKQIHWKLEASGATLLVSIITRGWQDFRGTDL